MSLARVNPLALIQLRETGSHRQLWQTRLEGYVSGMAISPDNRLVFLGGYAGQSNEWQGELWDTVSGKRIAGPLALPEPPGPAPKRTDPPFDTPWGGFRNLAFPPEPGTFRRARSVVCFSADGKVVAAGTVFIGG